MKHEKLPLSCIQDAKNFSVVKPMNSGEAREASPIDNMYNLPTFLHIFSL